MSRRLVDHFLIAAIAWDESTVSRPFPNRLVGMRRQVSEETG